MDNANSAEYLEKIKNQVIENIRRTMHKPSVQTTDVPPDMPGMDDEADAILDDEDEDENMESRYTRRRWDKYTEKDGELSESEDEEGNERNGVRRTRQTRKRNIMDYQNANAAPDDEEDLLKALNGNEDGEGPKMNGTVPEAGSNANSSPKSSPPLPPTLDAVPDQDVEMGEEQPHPSSQTMVEKAQEATPPASPHSTHSNVNGTEPAAAASPTANHPMEEAEEPAEAHTKGIEEREIENITAEKSTALAHESEQS